MGRFFRAALVVLAAGLLPTTASAQVGAAAALELGGDDIKRFGVGLTLDQTAAVSVDANTTFAGMTFVAAPWWQLSDVFRLTLSLGTTVDQTERPNSGVRADFANGATFLRLGDSSIYRDSLTGINLSGAISSSLMLSTFDRAHGRLPSPSFNLAASRSFYGVTTIVAYTYARNLFLDGIRSADNVDYTDEFGYDAEVPDQYRYTGGINVRDSHVLNTIFTWNPTERINLFTVFAFVHQNSFARNDRPDPRQPGELLSNNRNPFAFSFALNYSINDTYSLSTGLSTSDFLRPTGQSIGGPGSEVWVGGWTNLLFDPESSSVFANLNANF